MCRWKWNLTLNERDSVGRAINTLHITGTFFNERNRNIYGETRRSPEQ